MAVTVKSFDSPDQRRTPDKTQVDTVALGSADVARMTMQPGWKWSECIKPVAGTESCQKLHLGVALSGNLHVVHDDGGESDIGPGDAYVIEPGHDGWVVGDEPFVGYEFESTTAATFAQPAGS